MAEVKLNSFTKGMNNFLDPFLIGTEFASDLVDVDLTRGVLGSTKASRITSFTNEEDLSHYGKLNRSVAKQFGRSYWSIDDAMQAPYYGGNEMNLGIEPPKNLLQAYVFEAPSEQEDTGKKKATSKDEEETPIEDVYKLSGKYKYCYCYVVKGYESAPAEWNKTYYVDVTVESGYVNLYFEDIPEWVEQVKIYRTIDNGTEFYSLALVNRGVVAGGSYTDNTADVDLLLGEVMESLYNLPPPDNGKFLIENQGAFFCAVDDKLYFSEVFNCHAWNPSNWISFDDNITAITTEFQGLLVFTRNRSYKVVGNSIETIEKLEIPTTQGCVNNKTCTSLSNCPIWLSNDGLCTWDGQSISLLSHGICKIDNTPIIAVGANDCYYLFGKTNTIVYDTRIGGAFYRLSIKAEYAWYDADLDSLFYRDKENILQMFGSNYKQTSVYMTGLLGEANRNIEFRKIRVNSTNGFVVYLYNANGRLFYSKEVTQSGIVELYLPTSQWSNGVKFGFTFSGEIKEIILKTSDY